MANRKRLLKILAAISLAVIMLCGAGIFSACSMFTSDSSGSSSSDSGSGSGTDTETEEKASVTNVVLTGFNLTYSPDDDVDFDSMTITVYYDDGDSVVLSTLDFNETGKVTGTSVEAVIMTSGLYGEVGKVETVGGELPVGTYPISCVLSENGKTYSLGTVEITRDVSKVLDAVFFEDPEFLNTYKQNIARSGDMDDDNCFVEEVELEDYCVGSDNAFKFAPRLTVENRNTGDIYEMTGYDANVTVTLVGEEGEKVLPLEENDYVTYSNFEFDFSEESVGKQFRIEVSPADFDEDEFGHSIDSVGMVVNVESGYNVYNALDLGRMNLVDVSSDYSGCYETTSKRVFWDEYNNTFKQERTFDLWRDFLEDEGENPETLKATKGIYLQTDIDITSGDIPSEFFVTESEARQVGKRYENMVGSIRDSVYPYTRFMTKDFTLNGNLFKIDCSTIKYCLTTYVNDWVDPDANIYGYLDYYAEGATVNTTNSCLFSFLGLSDTGEVSKIDPNTKATAYIKNIDLRGNVSNPGYGMDAKAYGITGGSLQAIKSMASKVEVDNCIIREFSVGLHCEFSKDNYVCMRADNTKLLDIYNSGLYAWVSARNQLNSCVVKRVGGPAVMAASKTTDEWNTVGYYFDSGCDIDGKTKIENYVAGDEGWFVDMGITWIRTIIDMLDDSFKEAGKTLYSNNLNENGSTTLNLEFIGADNGMGMSATDTSEYLNLNFSFGDTRFVMNESEAVNTNVYGGPSYMEDGSWETLGYESIEEYEAALMNTYDGIDVSSYGVKLVYMTNTGKLVAPDIATVVAPLMDSIDSSGTIGALLGLLSYGNDPFYSVESLVYGSSKTSYESVELSEEDTEVFMYLYISMGSTPMMYVIGASLYDYVTPEGVSATLIQ